ncbi:PQQ-dependent sugar dehydrogenase [Micropruina sp.]|uniref:PQQ-dependent sugar dehydrogenase n=1 Tax=Micropruina sp. TaxID=2737536 RepID=UPI0039E5EE35
MADLRGIVALAMVLTLAGCGAPQPTPMETPPGSAAVTPSVPPSVPATASLPAAEPLSGTPFAVQELGRFDEPWAMTFLTDGDALITERAGRLVLRYADGRSTEVAGVPEVVHQGQGGLGDVIVSPDFATDRTVYLSWAARGTGGSGAEVGRATLVTDANGARLDGLSVIWRQQPKTSGSGHYGHRLTFSPDGSHLFVTSGERQKMTPAQDRSNTLGTIVAMDPDGGNAEIWSYGHRNPLGIAFDAAGNLWSSEMGPQGGDELNLIRQGRNYGWPLASNGSHYGGADIPDHKPGDGFEAPKVWWNPSVSPGSLMIYSGSMYPQWRGDAFIGALSGQALIRVDLDGTNARKGDQWDFGDRVREVEQAPDGSIWVLTDGSDGRLLRLTPG